MTLRKLALAFTLAAGTLLAGCDEGTFGSTSIANGGIIVRGEKVALHGAGNAEAHLDAAGDLTIDGRDVSLDTEQRQLLRQYYQGARAVREHGIATGKAGAALAAKSLESAAKQVVAGGDEHAEAGFDDANARVGQQAAKICLDLRQIKAAQDRLATTLPAFKPFAGIIDGEQDCKGES